MTNNADSLKKLAETAHRALHTDTEYVQNKRIIADLFLRTSSTANKEKLRLTVIDSMYSTNVNSRRLYGISDMAQELFTKFPADKALAKKAAGYIESNFDQSNQLHTIFKNPYGIDKSGIAKKRAMSLLSKYLYFVTDYNFPIYDRLGAPYIKRLSSVKIAPAAAGMADFEKRFKALAQRNIECEINNFDILDNLLWLCGKTDAGSYSLVLKKTNYQKLIGYLGIQQAEDIDRIIAAEIDARVEQNDTELEKVFGVDLYTFLQMKRSCGL
jgi:hypothetical protein